MTSSSFVRCCRLVVKSARPCGAAYGDVDAILRSPLAICAGVCLFVLLSIAVAQEPARPDTLQVAPADSALADTLAAPRDEGVDTTVHYEAERIEFDVIHRVSVLIGGAVIHYKDMTLEAERITVDWEKQLLVAEGVVDTIWNDSIETAIDTIIVRGKPHFVQASDDFFGDEIAYNMKSKIGRVKGGSTVYEQGFYYGEQFKRISDDVLTVRGGEFTSCESDPPHFHFAGEELKIIVGRRVLARPVVMYFDDVPVMAAPYGIFPQQKGRTSGIIIPTFGESSSQGRFLRDVGYYWAPSQYMDVTSTIDYFEKFGVLGRGEYRYAKIYALNGSARYAFDTQRQGGARRRDFSLSWSHNQTIDENTRVAATGSYVSSERFYQDTGNLESQLNQSVRSNATLSKSWYNSPWTMSANVGYDQNIRRKTWSATLPQLSLTHRSGLLFPPPKAPRGMRKASVPRETTPPWHRAFQWNYAVNYQNALSMPKALRQEGLRPGLEDIYGVLHPSEIIRGDDSSVVYQRDGFAHSGGVSATAKILKYLHLNPRISARHVWTRRVVNFEPDGKIFDRADESGFFTRTTFDLGTSLNTKLYGVAQKPFGLNASFRHVLTPSLSFTYRPDFSDKAWGYFETVKLLDGREYTFDRFAAAEMAPNVGGTPAGLSEFIGVGLDQLYQMKTGDPDENTEKKLDLLSWGSQTGVDLKRDSLKWDNISSSLRTTVPGTIFGSIEGLAVDASMTHSPYASVGSRRINTFYWEREGAQWYAPLELLNVSLNVGFAIRAESVKELLYLDRAAPEIPDTIAETTDTTALLLNPTDLPDIPRNQQPSPAERQGLERRHELFDMPVSLRFNFRRSRDYSAASSTSAMSANAQFAITPRWQISLDYILDLDKHIARNASVSVTRDLHCWEASLLWSPLGFRPGYFLRVGLKNPQLRDVKIERHRGAGLSGY